MCSGRHRERLAGRFPVTLAKAAYANGPDQPLKHGLVFLEPAWLFVCRYEGEVSLQLR